MKTIERKKNKIKSRMKKKAFELNENRSIYIAFLVLFYDSSIKPQFHFPAFRTDVLLACECVRRRRLKKEKGRTNVEETREWRFCVPFSRVC